MGRIVHQRLNTQIIDLLYRSKHCSFVLDFSGCKYQFKSLHILLSMRQTPIAPCGFYFGIADVYVPRVTRRWHSPSTANSHSRATYCLTCQTLNDSVVGADIVSPGAAAGRYIASALAG
jgi:hypothetical protein